MSSSREEWRPVPYPQYADVYEVSNYGHVRNRLTGHYMKVRRHRTTGGAKSGRCYVHHVVVLQHGGTAPMYVPIAALVAEVWAPAPEGYAAYTINEDPALCPVWDIRYRPINEDRRMHRDALRYVGKGTKPARHVLVTGDGVRHVFGSTRLAAEWLGCSESSVRYRCDGKHKSRKLMQYHITWAE